MLPALWFDSPLRVGRIASSQRKVVLLVSLRNLYATTKFFPLAVTFPLSCSFDSVATVAQHTQRSVQRVWTPDDISEAPKSNTEMAREPTQPFSAEMQQVVQQHLDAAGISRAELARLARINKSVVTRILDPGRRQPNVSVRAVREIARTLNIPLEHLTTQFELELEITEEFIEAARNALTDELLWLKQSIGPIRATRVAAVVGIEFHGVAPEKQAFTRVFWLPPPR